jgi:hypothetical protein
MLSRPVMPKSILFKKPKIQFQRMCAASQPAEIGIDYLWLQAIAASRQGEHMSTSVSLRFSSQTQLGLYIDEIRHTLDWAFHSPFEQHPGNGIVEVRREGQTFARLPFSIRHYGSIMVLEIVIEEDHNERSVEFIRHKLKDITTRVYTI